MASSNAAPPFFDAPSANTTTMRANSLGQQQQQQQQHQQQQQQQQHQQHQQHQQQHQQQQQQPTPGNGNGAVINGLPMIAGQQMDVNFLYQKVLELSDVLRDNRERVQGIVSSAEELSSRAAATGAEPSLQEANAEISSARVADLERRLVQEQRKNHILIHEQKENWELVHKWEHEVGKMVALAREHTFDNKAELTAQARHYNRLLQDEKDAHLASRLEKDDWHAKFVRAVGMLRKAYQLRCEEDEVPIRVVAGLQNEVRAFRSALGMEAEKFESEYGYEILKDVPGGNGKE